MLAYSITYKWEAGVWAGGPFGVQTVRLKVVDVVFLVGVAKKQPWQSG